MFARPFFRSRSLPRHGALASTACGLTLVEMMVSLAVLTLTAVGGVSGFVLLNQYASSLRNVSSAKALCQERIEQVQTMPFNPPGAVPDVLIPGSDPKLSTSYYYLLGPSGSYDSSGKYTGTGTAQTTSETVQVYVQQDGTTSTVPGTRTTTVSLAPLTNAVSSGTAGTSLRVVTFTVTVTYTYRGKSYSYSMYTLRSPD